MITLRYILLWFLRIPKWLYIKIDKQLKINPLAKDLRSQIFQKELLSPSKNNLHLDAFFL
jgi:hypothetical protein